jgi:methylated-DNA-[protein]-cysteine S-methyltransferase
MTKFQKDIYKVVARIPKGSVLSYGEVARVAGYPKAARAVGTLMATNPFSKTQVPCHRVVRSDGRIGAYSGKGGMKGKEKLLLKEGVLVRRGRIFI